MKRIITSALLIVFISCASFGNLGKRLIAEGKSFTPNGDFKIEVSDLPLVVNGVELDTYTITYNNSDLKVTIAIEKNRKCSKYITVCDKLAVQYVCNGSYFGVEKLTAQNAVNGLTTSDAAMDRSAYFHQKVLLSGQSDPVNCMKLIGAYFPELLKSGADA